MRNFGWGVVLAAACAVVVAVGFFGMSWLRAHDAEYEKKVATATASADREHKLAEANAESAAYYRRDGARARATARQATVGRDSALALLGIVRDSLDRLPAAPDTCLPWLEVYASYRLHTDSVLAADLRIIAAQDAALLADSLAGVKLGSAYAHLSLAYDSVRMVLDARPKPLPWWLPDLAVGPTCAITTAGSGCGVGVTLKLRL